MIKELRDSIQETDMILEDYDKSVETYIGQLYKLKKNIDSIEGINNRMYNERKNKNDIAVLTQKLLSKYEISEEDKMALLDANLLSTEGVDKALKILGKLREIFTEDTVLS